MDELSLFRQEDLFYYFLHIPSSTSSNRFSTPMTLSENEKFIAMMRLNFKCDFFFACLRERNGRRAKLAVIGEDY